MADRTTDQQDMPHAWDEFVAYVTNNPESRFITISAEVAKRLVSEHEGDLDSMERACAVVEAATVEQAALTRHVAWLIERIEWLKYEMDHGGNWQYLQLKREETMYCLEKLRAHIPALEQNHGS